MEAGRIVFKEESYRIMGACFEVYKAEIEHERFVNQSLSRLSRVS
jgi:hypothetical protein